MNIKGRIKNLETKGKTNGFCDCCGVDNLEIIDATGDGGPVITSAVDDIHKECQRPIDKTTLILKNERDRPKE